MDSPFGRVPLMRRERHFDDRVVKCYVERPGNAAGLLTDAVAHWPDAEALVDGRSRYTFAALDQLVGCVTGNLAAAGIVKGDRVALFLGNSAEFAFTLLGTIRLGAVVVPISTRLQRPEVTHIVRDSGARVLVFGSELRDQVPDLSESPPMLVRYVVGNTVRGELPFDVLLTMARAPMIEIAEDDPIAILYTSGTTGRPKGAIQTHLGIVHSVMQFEHCWGLKQGERCILAVPASHATGIGAVMMTMVRTGGTTIIMRQFKAADFLRLAASERLTYAAMVPAMYNLLLREPNFSNFDLSAWRVGGYGAAPMPAATIAALAQHLPKLELVNAYGATETTAPPLLMPLGGTATRPDYVGYPVPTAEVMVVGDDGRELMPDEAGEIWMRGPTIVQGYWNNPTANAEAFTDGWWHSGDIGAFDSDGYLKILDRKKDMINRGGYKIFSAEVEDALSHHPAVLECAVVGRPDPVLGERVHAFLVLRRAAAEDDLRKWCAVRLADYKVPERFTVLEGALPRNATGKALKSELRRLASESR
jgi:acyl-CoA synthetase (AMP-forming)/AMP-acid ligase II